MPLRHRRVRSRQPLVEIALSILNYLANQSRERLPSLDSDWLGVSRYDIRKHLPGTQHDRIVSDAIDSLLRRQYIREGTGSGPAKYYRITEAGLGWYNAHGRGFLDFAREVRKGPSD